MTRKVLWTRALGYGLIAAALLETLGMNLFTLAQTARARTSVPAQDEWALVQDLEQIDRGHALWPVLWAPYWGERQVVTRLLWMANARFHSLASLTWLTLTFQFVHIGILIAVAWVLLGRTSPPAVPPGGGERAGVQGSVASFLVACAVILNLMLSPFQMWNFVWSTQAMFVLSFLAAVTSFLCLALADGKRRTLFTTLAAAFAALGSFTMPNGLLVWPVLALQALCLRRRRAAAVLALIGAVAFGWYLRHYTVPFMRMGVGGMLRHPIQAILLVGVVVAGPVGFVSNALAAGLGVLTLAVTGYVSARALRIGVRERPVLSALVAIIVFLVLSSASIVAGRLDPRFLSRDPLYSVPVRYPTMVSLFWVAVALLALYTCWRRRARPVLLGFYAVPLLYFMFATVRTQYIMAEDWADYFRAADALGAAFLLDAPDEEMLAHLWPVRGEREERVVFLRRKGLAMFHEPRATWMGKNVSELFSPLESAGCIGGIEKTTSLGKLARVQGWAWDLRTGDSPDYVLLTDPADRIIGQARGGLRHGYIPGLLVEPGSVPPSHAHFRHSEWLGYVRKASNTPLDQIRLFGVFSKQRKVCALR
jgi:hypothetical protein